LFNCITPLKELNELVGMKSVKKNIVEQIMYFLQGLHKKEQCNKCDECLSMNTCVVNTSDMLHTVIIGDPGVGKTELSKILGKIYKEMGLLSKGHFVMARRSDLIGEYLGQTAIKTQKKIDEANGGVLFIDEAYSLSHKEGRDSFSKECIDTLNQNLTERRDFLCIIAGYKDKLEECFFKMNDGLRRRFTFRYDIEPYSWSELKDIFKLKVKKDGWSFMDHIDDLLNLFFKNKYGYFKNHAGDMENLLMYSKKSHSRRIFMKKEFRKKLSMLDINDAFIELKLVQDSNNDDYSVF
jgi:SpoVK/Ycf46/Vps4 family AAA+-type ATPase